MTCIDDCLLQKYIDGECTETETAEVKQHLAACPDCAGELFDKALLSAGIKGAINSLTSEIIDIPAFRNPKTTLPKKNTKLIIYSLSAACILLFVLFSVNEKNISNQLEINIVQSIPGQVDANRPASDQEFIIEVYDAEGNLSEFFIE